MDQFFASVPVIGAHVQGHFLVELLLVVVATVIAAGFTNFVVLGGLRLVARHTETTIDDFVIDALRRPLFYTVILAGLLWIAVLSQVPESVERIIVPLTQTLLIFLWAHFALELVRSLLHVSKKHPQAKIVKDQTVPFFENMSFLVIVGLAVYLIFKIWGVNMTAWLASAGIVGIAVGFAAKDTLANFFAGIFILADAPYQIGDYVVLDSGERGRVTHIGIRSTRILTRGDVEITVPNAVIGAGMITNESGGPVDRYRVAIDVGVAYGSDVDQVEGMLVEIANNHTSACKDPAPRVRLKRLGQHGLEYQLQFWIVDPEDRSFAAHVANREIYQQFTAAGIEIPYPKMDVYTHKQE